MDVTDTKALPLGRTGVTVRPKQLQKRKLSAGRSPVPSHGSGFIRQVPEQGLVSKLEMFALAHLSAP